MFVVRSRLESKSALVVIRGTTESADALEFDETHLASLPAPESAEIRVFQFACELDKLGLVEGEVGLTHGRGRPIPTPKAVEAAVALERVVEAFEDLDPERAQEPPFDTLRISADGRACAALLREPVVFLDGAPAPVTSLVPLGFDATDAGVALLDGSGRTWLASPLGAFVLEGTTSTRTLALASVGSELFLFTQAGEVLRRSGDSVTSFPALNRAERLPFSASAAKSDLDFSMFVSGQSGATQVFSNGAWAIVDQGPEVAELEIVAPSPEFALRLAGGTLSMITRSGTQPLALEHPTAVGRWAGAGLVGTESGQIHEVRSGSTRRIADVGEQVEAFVEAEAGPLALGVSGRVYAFGASFETCGSPIGDLGRDPARVSRISGGLVSGRADRTGVKLDFFRALGFASCSAKEK